MNIIASSSSQATTTILSAAHHGFASYSAVTKMEPSDDYPRLSLPGMPTEILSAIVNLASPATLPALRLTNKRLCAVSNKPFAIKHFCERRHVPSAYSMDALVEITAHPFFGKFVKTVVISGSRPELDKNPFLKGVVRSCVQCPRPNPLCKNPAPRHVALDFVQLRGKLDKTFSNIRRNSLSVCVGVRDSAYRCYGSVYYHADCNMISDQHLHSSLFSSARDDCNRLYKTFSVVCNAARSSGCKVDGIKVDTFSILTQCTEVTHHERQVQHMMHHLLGWLSGNRSFDLNLEMIDPYKPRYHLKYDHDTGELDLAGLDFGTIPEPGFMITGMELLLSRLSTCSLTQVRLDDCWYGKSDLSWVFRSQTIRTLTLHGVSFYTEQFDTNLWSSVLDRLARTTHLKRLEMLRCWYSFPEAENEAFDPFMRRPWIQIPSGVYELKNPRRWASEFILAPSGDVDEAIILTDQTSISGQLKALAAQVAQMELDKIAEIERDGYVRTDIVGVSKESQSEEDVIELGSMEDDGSDEADNERGESEENDDQDEHEHTVELSKI